MDLFAVVQHHGYAATVIVLFLSCCGLPMPMSVILLAAGAASRGGALNVGIVLLCAFLAALSGDLLMYMGGRYTGWWLLSGLCRLSMNPEGCIFGSANSFYRKGPRTLLIAKFVPGLATVAAPLAGSLNMRPLRFLQLDSTGILLYVSAWTAGGYLFAPILKDVVGWLERVGHFTAATLLILFVGYVAWLLISSLLDTRFSAIERVEAHALFEQMRDFTHADKVVVIADVRSHGYYDPGQQRIKNSIRVEPARLKEELDALREFMAPECEIYLYCSCSRDATSVRVAKRLEQENCRTKVISGGLKAWVKAGGPTEPVPIGDVEHLPRFE